MLNVLVALRLNSGATRDHSLATLCQNIWLEMAKNDFNLRLVHIAGKQNACADDT